MPVLENNPMKNTRKPIFGMLLCFWLLLGTAQAQVKTISLSGGGWRYQSGTKFNAGLEISLSSKNKYFKNLVGFHMMKEDYFKSMNLIKSYNQLTVGKAFYYEKGVFFTEVGIKTGLYYYDYKSFNYYLYSLGIPFNGSPEIGMRFNRFSISGGYNFFFMVGLRRAYTGNAPEYPNSQGRFTDIMGASFLKVKLNL
jgi:hypothetical protein